MVSRGQDVVDISRAGGAFLPRSMATGVAKVEAGRAAIAMRTMFRSCMIDVLSVNVDGLLEKYVKKYSET